MRLVFTSDTHTCYPKLPDGDILVHCGDLSARGTKEEIEYGLSWFSSQMHRYKIFIAGNHDFGLEAEIIDIPSNLIYLKDSSISINGLNFWGSPWASIYQKWAFMKDSSGLKEKWALIPNNTDILITHSPPKGILDKTWTIMDNVGCPELWNRVLKVKPKIHAFGHIHESFGMLGSTSGTLFLNCSYVANDFHQHAIPGNSAWIVDL